jgi:ATP/maltotriose-dependent transcriptional regulator MalT
MEPLRGLWDAIKHRAASDLSFKEFNAVALSNRWWIGKYKTESDDLLSLFAVELLSYANTTNDLISLSDVKRASWRAAWRIRDEIKAQNAIHQITEPITSVDQLPSQRPTPSPSRQVLLKDFFDEVRKRLSDTEMAIMDMVLDGAKNDEIAEQLRKSPATVRVLRHRLLARLRQIAESKGIP